MVRLKFALAGLAFCIASSASAQNYPNRAITIVVPFAQGGLTDVPVRLFASVVQEKLGVPVVVENKTGGSGSVGATHVLRSDPDGYTLLLTTSSHATLPALSKLPWHPSNDFVPVAAVYSYPFVFITNSANSSRFKTLGDFLAYARANPGKVNWGSSGLGGPQHLTGLQFIKLGEGRDGPCAIPRQRANDAGAGSRRSSGDVRHADARAAPDGGRQGRPPRHRE